jgi:hypothetical protein
MTPRRRPGHLWSLACVCVVSVLVAACDAGPASIPSEVNALSTLAVAQRLAVGPVADRPWAMAACTPGALAQDVLACVDGVAITRAAFDRVRVTSPESVANREIIDALIAAEVLAAEAGKRGLWGEWLLDPFRSALVRRLLSAQFVDGFAPKDVKQTDIDRAFIRGAIRVRYAHETAWSTIDAQFLCCTGDWHRCEIDVKVAECAERYAPEAYALAAELAANPPKTKSEFRGRVLANKPIYPNAALQEVAFYYDATKPYDKQGEYDKMLETWTLAVIQLQPGQVSTPIRSAYGWHVVMLTDRAERREGKPTDPDIRADIATGILDGVRERDILLYVTDLMRSRNTQLFYDALEL